MQLPSSHLSSLHRPFLGFRPQSPKFSLPSSSSSSQIPTSNNPRISCNFSRDRSSSSRDAATTTIKSNKKDNIWSIDNELAKKELGSNNKRTKKNKKGSAVRMRKKRGKGVSGKKGRNGLVLVSAAMLMEIETVLQTQEPVIKPSWSTFASSVSGIWKGVGAVFSPFTAEMEPIGMGNQNENLYDCYTLSRIERSPSESLCSQIQRKTNWVALNPSGESRQHMQGSSKNYNGESPDSKKGKYNAVNPNIDLPAIGSFDFGKNELLEEDSMSMEPGLVFFEDGSYSRGPVDIPVGEFDESKYFLSPTFKFEQCLVKGCHKRLRIVHTIEFGEGGSDIQIVRVAVYEEQWISPVNLYDENDEQVLDLIPLSQRQRTQPSELAGSWKVFEVSATPIYGEEDSTMDSDKEQGGGPPYVYLCTETVKKRSLPESAAYFGEEEMLDMNDVTVLWLPGGVTGYVDVSNDGTLCIGVGWYSHEGINLVMERDYGMDGKLKEVRWKSEVKRRWSPDHSGSA